MALSCLFGARRSVEHRCDYVRNALLTINVYFCDGSGGEKSDIFGNVEGFEMAPVDISCIINPTSLVTYSI